MKIMLILGNDKLSGEALRALASIGDHVLVVVDCSTGLCRVFRLLIKKRLSLLLLIRMAWCSFLRKGENPSRKFDRIKSNDSIQSLLKLHRPECVVLFRAGLVINVETINTGIPMLNIHCARIPEYAGLGSIYKALKDKAWEQEATLHRVTKTIDGGEVIISEPYRLDPQKSYCENEDIAYKAGIRLLGRALELANSTSDFLQGKEF